MNLLFYFIFIFFILFSNISYSNKLFETSSVNVKFINENIDDFKNKKIDEVKYLTLDLIFNKILLKKNYNNLKRNLDIDFANIFIKNIIINNEKIINNSYSADIKINYNKKLILDYLRLNKIPYVEEIPKNYLTIIYFKNDYNKHMLTKNNKYYEFLINKSYNFYFIPDLSINDRYLLDFKDIENLDVNKINNFKNKYNNIETIIFKIQESNNIYEIEYYLVNKKNLYLIEKTRFDNHLSDNFFIKIQDNIIDKWKEFNLIQNEYLNYLTCKIHYLNLLELKKIKSIINSISLTHKIELIKMSYNVNTYNLEYYGNNDILVGLLNANRIRLKYENENCNIKLL
ncbi:MAG: hypothetical protein CMI96_01375 [Pelagibacteraceae bacterium]|nr:hypothetical protein [Pelagibacteraceae bacterium]|tara:strand:- start:3432 stop:4460 length:1029 start_codon:yes stop_codon:yes gene_type:complete